MATTGQSSTKIRITIQNYGWCISSHQHTSEKSFANKFNVTKTVIHAENWTAILQLKQKSVRHQNAQESNLAQNEPRLNPKSNWIKDECRLGGTESWQQNTSYEFDALQHNVFQKDASSLHQITPEERIVKQENLLKNFWSVPRQLSPNIPTSTS